MNHLIDLLHVTFVILKAHSKYHLISLLVLMLIKPPLLIIQVTNRYQYFLFLQKYQDANLALFNPSTNQSSG